MGFVKDAWDGVTGKTAAKSAEKAGQMQSDSAKYAADIGQKQYEQTRQDMQPWMQAGQRALGGLENFVFGGSPVAYSAAPNTPSPASTGLMGNAPAGAPMQFSDAMGQNMQRQYNSGAYTNGLDAQSFYQDPSYQWRKQQGMDNIQAQAAAGGGLFSGATLKALNDYNSNLASQEYGNAWQRNMAESQNRFNVDSNLRSQDYNIFNSERSRQYNEMANLAGVGQTTATNLASLGANNAANMGEMAMAGANAQANGLTTGAYAKSQGMGNLLGLGMKAFGLF